MRNKKSNKIIKIDSEQVLHHWRYFLSLEKDFVTLTQFIEVHEDNFDTYSFELSKLLQLSCAEIDTVCRLLCSIIDPTTDYFDDTTRSGNIAQYKPVILKRFPKLPDSIINVPQLQNNIRPWLEWNSKDSPDWWNNYNKVKHYRHSCFDKANLATVIYSLTGLMVLILYFYRLIENKPYTNPSPSTEYFFCDYCSPFLATRAEKELPDFE